LNKNLTVIDVCGHEFSTLQKEKVRKQEVYICDCIHAIQGQCQERVSEKDPLDSLQEPTFLKDDTTQGPEPSCLHYLSSRIERSEDFCRKKGRSRVKPAVVRSEVLEAVKKFS
jgi:hypothetical protein